MVKIIHLPITNSRFCNEWLIFSFMLHGFDISGISWCTLWLWRPFQVTFHYVGYNESGRRIDSTYLQGSPARIRVGTNALVPGS